MEIVLCKVVVFQPEAGRPGAHVRHCGPGRLLHHVPQLTGEKKLSAARDGASLNEKHIPARGSPGETRGHAGLILLLDDLASDTWRPQIARNLGLRYRHPPFTALSDRTRDLAGDGADFSLQAANAGL